MAKTVFITGGTRGIGRACAELFARHGYNVAVCYLNSEDEAAELRSLGMMAVRADVSDRGQVDSAVGEVKRTFGSIDVLVCNAAIASQGLFTDMTAQQWQRMVDVDLTGVFNCCKSVLDGMIHKKSGSIITLSSVWGLTGASCEVAYSAVKAGVIGLTKALAKEVGPSGIRVNCVAPGVIATDMNAALDEETIAELTEQTPLGIIGQPEDIARTVMFLADDSSRFITGQIISPNGGMVI